MTDNKKLFLVPDTVWLANVSSKVELTPSELELLKELVRITVETHKKDKLVINVEALLKKLESIS